MLSRSLVSPEDQSATFVELFFDLVFVFAVTQVVGLLHHGLEPMTLFKAVLVFWLVWWAWTQYAWALNAADTTHPLVDLLVLVATGITFFMAVALPEAFGERAMLFALTYVAVRALGLTLYLLVASAQREHLQAVRLFAVASLAGLAAVLVGAWLGGTAQLWLWGLAILLDVLAAGVSGRANYWNLHPEHFGERHGLFVIIALGETLIVAAGMVALDVTWTGELLLLAGLAVAVTCALWWTYFPRAKPQLDKALCAANQVDRAALARDSFSLLHFPMVCGLIAFAVAVEAAVAHPSDPLELPARLALALALVLFVGGMGLAVWRATGRVLGARFGLVALGALAVLFLAGVSASVSMAIALVAVLAIALFEERLGLPMDEGFAMEE